MTARPRNSPGTYRRSIPTALAVACLVVMMVGSAVAKPVHTVGATAVPAVHGPLTWTQIYPTTSPGPRNWAAMAYDKADKEVVLYGGYDAYTVGLYSDTWTYSGGAWTQLTATVHPNGTSGLVLAWDPALKGVLAFGGQSAYGAAYFNDTWLFKGGNWTQLAPKASPPIRSQYAMAYDPATSEMVLFGGYNGGSQYLSDTWTFNGLTWTQVHSKSTPMGREFASMVYDPAKRWVLLVGGQNSTTTGTVSNLTLGGTWAFNGASWKQLGARALGSTPDVCFAYTSNLPNGTPVLFGGNTPHIASLSNYTYEFYDGAWHNMSAPNGPYPRGNGGFAYDARDGYILLFGGKDAASNYDGDTWELK
jgi:hypothetical protein